MSTQCVQLVDPWPSECALIIPCFNEAGNIGAIVKQAKHYLPKIIVVDDGSTDATSEAAKGAGARVIRLATRQGKGAALTAGWQTAADQGLTWALNMDGDGQHLVSDVPKFFEDLTPQEPALVIGNRMENPAAMPWLRKRVNRWMSSRLSKRAGLVVPDSQCGFRLLHLPSWSRMELTTRHFEIESELITAARRIGIPIRFVPIEAVYNAGGSNINPLIDTFRWLRWFFSSR